MNEQYALQPADPETEITVKEEIHEPDDEYPGTFFRVPGTPIPGQTCWSLS